MNIGLDIDGTIDGSSESSQFFALLSKSLKAAGHQVHIVTYRDPESIEETKRELSSWKISYDELHLPDGNLGMGEWKADIAKAMNLDIMVDDRLEILAVMPEKVLRFWVVPEDVLRG